MVFGRFVAARRQRPWFSLAKFSKSELSTAGSHSMGIALPQYARSGDRVPIDVYIVSPNPRIRQVLQDKLGLPRWNVAQARSGTGALELLYKAESEDAVLLLDPMLPDLEPNEFHGIVKDRFPNTQVLMLNSHTGQL